MLHDPGGRELVDLGMPGDGELRAADPEDGVRAAVADLVELEVMAACLFADLAEQIPVASQR
jgi:hypothetical protein